MPYSVPTPTTAAQRAAICASYEASRALTARLPRTFTVLKIFSTERTRWEAATPDRPAADGVVSSGARTTTDADPTPAPGTPLCCVWTCGNIAAYRDTGGALYCADDRRPGMRKARLS